MKIALGGLRLEVSKSKNALGVIMIIACIGLIYWGSRQGGLVFIGSLVFAVLLLRIAFILASDLILAPILNQVSGLFYGKAAASTTEYKEVDGFIVRHQYEQALEALNQIIEEKPNEPVAQLKRCELLADQLQKPQEAIEHAYLRLNQKELAVEDAKLALLTCDLLITSGHRDHAKQVLSSCVPKLKDPLAKKNLQTRFSNLFPSEGAL